MTAIVRQHLIRALLAVLALLVSQSALAGPAPLRAHRAEERPAAARALPDYDGRGSAYDAEPAWVWGPRVVLFPLWAVSEYGVRRPLGAATVAAERANLTNLLVEFFTFGPNRSAGIVPTGLIDFGFRPSVGVYAFWDDALAPGNDLRLHAATWGPDWLKLTLRDTVHFDGRTSLSLRGAGFRREDFLFYGLGARSSRDDESRYASAQLDGSLIFRREFSKLGSFEAYAGVRSASFESEACCGELTIGERAARGAYELPPGFEGYAALRHGVRLELDSRKPRPEPGSGVRAMVRGEQVARLSGAGPRQWLRYGGALGAFGDLNSKNRVLGVSLHASFADALGGDEPVPFTEQASLGGDEPLRGFVQGRLIDRSAVAARVSYSWPVWALLDGALQAEAGNVFGEHLEGFDPALTRLSFTLGVKSAGRRDHPFEFLIGTGTTPLSDSLALDSIRLVIGAENGF